MLQVLEYGKQDSGMGEKGERKEPEQSRAAF